jgi:hypothetical protein
MEDKPWESFNFQEHPIHLVLEEILQKLSEELKDTLWKVWSQKHPVQGKFQGVSLSIDFSYQKFENFYSFIWKNAVDSKVTFIELTTKNHERW